MARTYTKAELDAMDKSSGSYRMAMEIDALEAEQEALEAQDTPSSEAVETNQTPVEEPQKEDPKPAEEVAEPVKDVEFWKKVAEDKQKEADNWHKRQKDAMHELTPAQQEASRLRNENADLASKLDEINKRIEEMSKNRVNEVASPEDMEFDDTYPDIAKRIKQERERAKAEAKAELEERLKKTEMAHKEVSEIRARMEKEQEEARLIHHYNAVKAIHPDVDNFLNQTLGPALVEWAKTQPPYVGRIIQNVAAHDPADVADVITRFKVDTGMSRQVQKPSLGDRVAKTMTAPPVVSHEEKRSDILSDKDFADIDRLLRQSASNNAEQERLLAAYEKTLLLKQNRK